MALSKKCKARLTTLIKFMEKLPKEASDHFSMKWWVLHQGSSEIHKDEHSLKKGLTKDKLMSCGTAACAAGWAASIPEFRRAGFRMVAQGHDACMRPRIEPYKFFDLPYISTERELFGSDVPVETPKEWADHARRWMKRYSRKAA